MAHPEIKIFLTNQKQKNTNEKVGKNFLDKYNLFFTQKNIGTNNINAKKTLFKKMNKDTNVNILKFVGVLILKSLLNINVKK
tara:strand:- start:179 stop:424 length:246 start_codon:yes stop_codon:yes gene_type:complete